MSFVNATLVLSIGETVEEVTDSGFLGTTPTISCSQLGDDALVQVLLARNTIVAHCSGMFEHTSVCCVIFITEYEVMIFRNRI